MEKSSKAENTSNSGNSSSRPFFTKSGKEGFFSQSKEKEIPFFSSNIVQAKLTIGQPNDIYEQEADAVAERVVAGDMGLIGNTSQVPTLQSKCAACSEEEDKIQRMEADAKPEERIQTKPVLMRKTQEYDYTGTAPLISQLNESKGGGQSLPESSNQDLSQSFGTDFSHVRVHTDGRSAEMNQGINARAFTHGSDIYFNNGQYNPGSAEGKKLLAHELVHTIQQGYAGKKVQKKPDRNQSVAGGTAGALTEDELVRSQVNSPRIQRSVNWAAGTVHEAINSASHLLGGADPITWEMLNGKMLQSHAIAAAAIKSPTLSTSKVTSKAGVSWNAKVTAVPLNEGSFDETVYAPGPWTRVVPKATVGAAFGIAACAGKGNTTFQSKGNPSDDQVYKANRRHEDHHADDHHAAFTDIVKTWDTKVTKAKNNGTEVNGATAADAEANLWAAMGGTPAAVAINFNDECGLRGAAFHKTAKGGPITQTGQGSDKTCTDSWVFVKNPS